MIRALYLRWHARQLYRAIENVRLNIAMAEQHEQELRADLRRVQAQLAIVELDRRYAVK